MNFRTTSLEPSSYCLDTAEYLSVCNDRLKMQINVLVLIHMYSESGVVLYFSVDCKSKMLENMK